MHQEQANLFKVLSERMLHYLGQGEIERARKIAETAVEAARRASNGQEAMMPEFVEALRQLASLRLMEKDWEGAELVYKEAFELARGNRHVPPRQIALLKCELATALDHQDKTDMAVPLYQDAIEILESPSVDDPLLAAHIRNNLGLMFKAIGRLDIAEDHYLKALEVFEQRLGETSEEIAALHNNIGGLYHAAGHYERALDVQNKALEIHKSLFGETSGEVGQSLSNIAAAYHALGMLDEAQKHYAEAVDILRDHMSADATIFQIAADNYADLLRLRGESGLAEEIEAEARAVPGSRRIA